MQPTDRDPITDPKYGDEVRFPNHNAMAIVEWCRFDARAGGALCVGFEGGSWMRWTEYQQEAEVIHAAD